MGNLAGAQIVAPVIAMAGWTMLIWAWMLATRLPALSKAGVKLGKLRGGTGRGAEGVVPDEVQWKAHNYNHLHEAPTVFYAVALALALIEQGDGLNAKIAWAYVALRIVHSIWQSTVNKVMPRFMLFALSSLCLMVLTLHLVLALFH